MTYAANEYTPSPGFSCADEQGIEQLTGFQPTEK